MVILSFLTAFLIIDSKDAMSMDLSQFQWKNRQLFIFAPDGNHPFFAKLQKEISAQTAEVEDRDLVVFEVLEKGPARMNRTLIDPDAADAIRKRFAAARNRFTLVLVGKDGGIKLKRHDPIDLIEIFNLIDSMPMRKDEMRSKPERDGGPHSSK